MDFNKLNYLMTVAELRSFSKAAEKCFVSQPSLTRCVKSIEEELGLKLFDRSCSPIRLTYAGERYIEGMRKIIDLKALLDQEMADLAARRIDRLVIGIPYTRSATWLPRVLPIFQKECPGVDIQLLEGNTYTLEQQLSRGVIDLYLMGTEPVLTKGLVLEPLFREKMMLVVSRQSSALKGLSLPDNEFGVLQYIPPALLERIPFYSPTPSQGTYYFAHRLFDQYDIKPLSTMEIINTTAAYQMAPRSRGFALAPVTVSYEENFNPVPIFCSISEDLLARTAGVLYQQDAELSDVARDFIRIAGREIRLFSRDHIPQFEVRHDIDFSSLQS